VAVSVFHLGHRVNDESPIKWNLGRSHSRDTPDIVILSGDIGSQSISALSMDKHRRWETLDTFPFSVLPLTQPSILLIINVRLRIEDDVLVTEGGNDVLSAIVPKTIEEIERIIGAHLVE
jgi:hypothetical protein